MAGLIASIKTTLYNWFAASGLIYRLFPILGNIVLFFCFRNVRYEDEIEDEAGAKMRVTHWNGKRYPAFGKHRLEAVKDVAIRKSDVLLCGYPKTGCHWTYEILMMLLTKKAKLSKYGKGLEGMIDAMPHIILDSIASPRVMNSHLLYEDLPRGVFENKNKIILTMRNPKDTVVSFYHHTKNLHQFYNYDGTFENYFKMFMKGEVDYGDYFDFYMSWNRVIKENSCENQVYFLEFEELKENPVKKIKEMAEFLEVSITDEFAEEVAQVSSFDSMKKARKKSTVIFRKGIVGDWKNALTEEQAKEVDEAWREKMVGFELSSRKDPMP